MKFTANIPFETDQPTLKVDAGLPPGRHLFRLVVVDNSGLQSKAAVATVVVEPSLQPPLPPTPIERG